jgi:hypothetical protein
MKAMEMLSEQDKQGLGSSKPLILGAGFGFRKFGHYLVFSVPRPRRVVCKSTTIVLRKAVKLPVLPDLEQTLDTNNPLGPNHW